MSFLFGKKSKDGKGHNAPSQRPPDAPGAAGSGTSIPTVNGQRAKERGAGVLSPPPGPTSVNNSVNSVDDGEAPSPEHVQAQRGRMDSDLSVRLSTMMVVGCLGAMPFPSGTSTENEGIEECYANAFRTACPATRARRASARRQSCSSIPMVPATTYVHLLSTESFPSLWRSSQCCRFERGGCLPYGWPSQWIYRQG